MMGGETGGGPQNLGNQRMHGVNLDRKAVHPARNRRQQYHWVTVISQCNLIAIDMNLQYFLPLSDTFKLSIIVKSKRYGP